MSPRLLPFALLILATPAAAEAPRTGWQNSLKPKGTPGPAITLVDAGTPRYEIAVSHRPTAQELTAADHLQRWLAEISGGKLDITSTPTRPHVRIETDRQLGDEEFRIAVDGDNVRLTGGPGRGVINAVYALLEEDLGCRWYTRTDVRLPKSPTLRVAVVPRRDAPRLKLRDPYYACAFDADWSLRNRTNAPNAAVPEAAGGHVDYGGLFVHTHHTLVPPDKYFKEHPEYFQMNAAGKRVPVHLCTTNPEVRKVATAAVLDILKKSPHTEIVSVSKVDVPDVCHCPECKKLREAEGSDMANQLLLVNEVAVAVEKEYPRVVVDTLAYLETIAVPKTARPRKNVAIRLCNDTVGAWGRPFTKAEQCPVAGIARAWSAAHDRIYVWDYTVNFSHYLVPMPNLDVIAADIRFWAANKAEGVMLEGGYQGPAERDELKSWVAAKLMWDPSRDENELAADFVYGHYGPAAPAIMEYERLLAETAKAHAKDLAAPAGGIRYNVDHPFLSKEFLDRATAIFARAVELAGSDAATVRKVERAELPILYVKAARGPDVVGPGYAAVLDRYERIARREGVQYLAEGAANFEQALAAWRQRAK